MEPLLNIAVNAARQAGEIINRYVEQVDRLKILPKTAMNILVKWTLKRSKLSLIRYIKPTQSMEFLPKKAVFSKAIVIQSGSLIHWMAPQIIFMDSLLFCIHSPEN